MTRPHSTDRRAMNRGCPCRRRQTGFAPRVLIWAFLLGLVDGFVTRPPTQRIQQHLPIVTTTSSASTHLSSRWGNTDEIEGADVLKSCIPYVLPLLDGEHFGRWIYMRVPPLGFLDSLFVGPLYDVYAKIPLAGLILFLALTLGTRGNTKMSRNVRFNAQQAALIDVALVFPELIGSVFDGVDMPRSVIEPSCNFVWYAYMSAVLYCIYSIVILKRKPDKIPWISPYSEQMTGPL